MINTKRIFTALLLAIIAVTGYAYDFEVDGIYYSYDVYGNAVVTHGDKKYTGKIKIPSEVKWNGKKKKGSSVKCVDACRVERIALT